MTSDGLTKIGKNLWRIRAQMKDPRGNRKISRTKTVRGTQRDARIKLEELRAEMRRAAPKLRRLTPGDYATEWLLSRAPSLKPGVRSKYANNIEMHIIPGIGHLYLDRIEPADVRRFLTSKLGKRSEGKLSPNTVLNMLRLLRTIARDAQAEGHIKIYFCNRVDPPAIPEGKPNMLDKHQLRLMLAAVPARWESIVTLLAYTGLRWGEVSGLRWEDIDRKAGVIHVRRGNYRGGIVTTKNKGSKRTVPLLPDVLDKLGTTRRGFIFMATNGKEEPELHKGSPLRAVLTKACAKAGVPRITPHGLRRTFNNLARQVSDRLVVKSIVGHMTDEMHEHYSSVSTDEKTIAATRVKDLVDASGQEQAEEQQDSGDES